MGKPQGLHYYTTLLIFYSRESRVVVTEQLIELCVCTMTMAEEQRSKTQTTDRIDRAVAGAHRLFCTETLCICMCMCAATTPSP